ncbi:MAG TPA: pilus assembly protein TadG-related protein [Candidatus Limnocylindria bacterium]|jgi:Flp pilus assembly protein TadG|nr:pilus assembly protein TadG-related protein [Candidatus Limnocylindria bacterium]
MNSLRRFFFGREGEQGQAVVLFAILMLALLFAVGLAIDAGQLYSAKRTEQEAADAAAFAGAVVLYQGGTNAQAIAAATADATLNGYTHGVNNTEVYVYSPPISGSYQNNQHVEVVITRQVRTSLVPAQAAFNPVRARGVAGAEALNNGYAIMALDRGNTCNAFITSSNGDLHLTGGGILVNSSCTPNAANNSQNDPARFTIQSPYSLDVNGAATGSWFTIPVNTGYNQVADPFAGFPKPSTSGLPTCNSLAACRDVLGNQNPGVYTVNLGGNGTLRLNPGIYILKAGMDTAGNADFGGTGVFLYNTYMTYPAAPGALPDCGMINLQGNAASTLSAQTTGTWANLLVYQDPACTDEMKIGGNASFTGTGSIYLPNARFRFDGNPSTLNGSQLIAQTVDIQNGNITINYNPVNTAQPILPRLAE